MNKLTCSTVEAGRTHSYIETVSPSQADTVHKAIKSIDAQTMAHEFESMVRLALPLLELKGKKVKLGVDVTEDQTWTQQGKQHTRPSSHKNMHHIQTWQYLSISIVEPYFIPLMSLPYRQTDDLDTLVISLLKYVKTLPFTIKLVLFDRGFYHAHLIDYLENRRGKQPTPYLMYVRKTDAVKNYIYQTSNFDWFLHEMEYSKDKSKWHPQTTIVVLKPDPVVHPDIAWPFATNQEPTQELLDSYPKRWNHETGFRIHDEGHIKSKSSHPLIRFFYHLLGMLFIIVWRIQSIRKSHVVFKRFLKAVEHNYRELILFKEPPPIIVF